MTTEISEVNGDFADSGGEFVNSHLGENESAVDFMEQNEDRIVCRARWNPVFRSANECRLRYRILKGSAGSGKSVNVAQDFIKKLSDTAFCGANLLVVRKVNESNRDSTFAELCAAVVRLFGVHWERVWSVSRSPMMLECRLTGCRIIFKGVRDSRDVEKLKSVSFARGKLTWIWIEEATELLRSDVEILDDRLRGELPNERLFYQITMTFNPVSAAHWIKAAYFDRPNGEVFTHHSTYLDNRFIDEGYRARMERRRLADPDGYRVYGLGEWGECDGLILSNVLVHDFGLGRADFDVYYYGQDFGFNHANAILGVGYRDGELYVCEELYLRQCDTGEVIRMATERGFDRKIEMFCDSAEPDRIKMWRAAGFRARPVRKEPGCVKMQIDWLRSRRIHLLPSCTNTARELAQWRWKKDTVSGLFLDEPVEVMDDAAAALRYSVERLRRGCGVEIL